jgi:hypothetical protein
MSNIGRMEKNEALEQGYQFYTLQFEDMETIGFGVKNTNSKLYILKDLGFEIKEEWEVFFGGKQVSFQDTFASHGKGYIMIQRKPLLFFLSLKGDTEKDESFSLKIQNESKEVTQLLESTKKYKLLQNPSNFSDEISGSKKFTDALNSIINLTNVSEKSLTIIYYTGHGDKGGNWVLNDAFMNVDEVKNIAKNCRTRLVIILDCCNGFEWMNSFTELKDVPLKIICSESLINIKSMVSFLTEQIVLDDFLDDQSSIVLRQESSDEDESKYKQWCWVSFIPSDIAEPVRLAKNELQTSGKKIEFFNSEGFLPKITDEYSYVEYEIEKEIKKNAKPRNPKNVEKNDSPHGKYRIVFQIDKNNKIMAGYYSRCHYNDKNEVGKLAFFRFQ